MVGNTIRQLTTSPAPPPPKKKHLQVGGGLFGVHRLILFLKFKFSKSIKSSTFHIFLGFTAYPFPKCPEITQKIAQNRTDKHYRVT